MLRKIYLLGLLLPAASLAQSGKAELFGTITDASGLPVPRAKVQLEEAGTKATYAATASERGAYHFLGLAPGSYRLTVEKPGFRAYTREGLQLRVADRIGLDVRLEVGEMRQTVEVTGAATLLESGSATVAAVVEQKRVVTLPLDGRNFIPLIALAPGVALPPGSFFPRINGSRPRTSEYLYDGISVLQPEPGQVAFYPIIDAIEEFRVNVNDYSAEYGRSNGGVIQVSTKSGSNDYHGTLFEFFRNEKLNARNLFASSGAKPEFRRNQFGFVLGGPLRRNRTFFFADYQGSWLRTGVVRTSTVPSAAQREGIFPDRVIPVSQFDPAARLLLDRYPLPNLPGAANNYRRTGTESQNQDQFDARLDHYLSNRQRVFGRYSWLRDRSLPVTPLPDGSGAITSGVIGNTLTRADSVVAEHNWNLSAASLNQLRAGYTRRAFGRSALRETTQVIPNLPGNQFSGTLPVFQIAGFQQLGPTSSANAQFRTAVTEFLDTFSTVRARHSLKAGADIRRETMDVLQPPNPSGLFQFDSVFTGNSLASFLLGEVSAFQIDLQRQQLQPRANIAEFFLQDDWRATDRLALNLGVRYTLNFPSTEAQDRGAVFNLGTQRLDFLGKDGYPRTARELETHDFGPRLGLSYRVSDSLVIRSGYGLVWIEQAGITTPFTTPLFPFIQSVGQRSLDNVTPAFLLSQGPSVEVAPPNPDSGLGQGVFSVDRHTGSGYAQQWNFVLQKTFGNFSLEAGYLGSKLTRLGVPDVNLNQLTAGQLALGSRLTELVPNPYYGEIPASSSLGGPLIARQQLLRPFSRFTAVSLYRNNIGNSIYHSFQARLEKRFSKGLTFTLAYTFSKLLDDASSVFDAAILTGPVANFPVADSFNRRLERDVSSGDMPHVFSSGFVYELPFGLRLGGIIRLQSGLPVAVAQATNYNAFAGFGTQRPNRVADPALPADERTTARYFNPAAFTAAPPFAIGNSSRNPVRGPGYQDADLMLGKSFNFGERLRSEFRAEVFNLSNTPPLGLPNGNFGTPAFGSISSAGDPRVFELVLKVNF